MTLQSWSRGRRAYPTPATDLPSRESMVRDERLPGQARRPARVPHRRVGGPRDRAGQACCGSTRFGMTANNVTYAVMGEAKSYWDFFPAEDGWGRVPTWGFAEVEAQQRRRAWLPGTRVYGYLPPSSHLVVTPVERGRAAASSTKPPTGRRCPPPTTATSRPPPTPSTRPDDRGDAAAAAPALLHLVPDRRPARRRGVERARGPILISSASSKTAIAAAFLLARRDGVELDRPHLGRETRSSSPASASTAAPSPTTRSTRSATARRPTSTSPATAPCARRSTPTSATSSPTA